MQIVFDAFIPVFTGNYKFNLHTTSKMSYIIIIYKWCVSNKVAYDEIW